MALDRNMPEGLITRGRGKLCIEVKKVAGTARTWKGAVTGWPVAAGGPGDLVYRQLSASPGWAHTSRGPAGACPGLREELGPKPTAAPTPQERVWGSACLFLAKQS